MRKPILGSFARAVGIDVAEAELPLAEYQSVNDFFVRRLRPGARTFPDDADVLACPVDGVVGQLGAIRGGEALQAKGRPYSVARLLDDAALAARYDGGSFITLYLSPRHYHRIHSPCAGAVPMARHVPGALLPVNQPAISHVQDLFPKNERLVCAIDGAVGRIAVVAIGAYNVGRISAAFDPGWPGAEEGWVTNRGAHEPHTRHYQPPRPVRQGEEIMAFHLGSTVVVLAEPGRARIAPRIEPGCEVRLGEAIAHAQESGAS
jgi:phosphatidylserine decarboxylase